jgi:hypothetical protein
MSKDRDRDMADVSENRSDLGDKSGDTQGGSGGQQGPGDEAGQQSVRGDQGGEG